jgi:hypothetical protein
MLSLNTEPAGKKKQRGINKECAGRAQQEAHEGRTGPASAQPFLIGPSALALLRSCVHALA